MWDPGGGQDGRPPPQVVLLALPVDHQDGDVVATLFHLVEDIVSIVFEVGEKEGGGDGSFFLNMCLWKPSNPPAMTTTTASWEHSLGR